MLSIDEAIEMYKKIANTDSNCPRYCMNPCEECVKECKQVSEWLEELKAYREIGTVEECRNSVLDIPKAYNKAIDESICKVEEHKTKGYVTGITNNPFEFGACQMADDIVKILEQLKVGGENDNLRR